MVQIHPRLELLGRSSKVEFLTLAQEVLVRFRTPLPFRLLYRKTSVAGGTLALGE